MTEPVYGILHLERSTLLPAIITDSLSLARIETQSSGYAKLATSTTDRDAILLRTANRVEEQVLDDFPQLSLTTSTLTTVASQRYVALPTTLRNAEIFKLEWDSSTDYQGLQLRLISESDVELLDLHYVDDNYSLQYPVYASIDHRLHRLNFYPMPNSALTLTCIHRVARTPYTALDLATATATVVSAIPDTMMELMINKLAQHWRWVTFGSKDNDRPELDAQYQAMKSTWIAKLNRPIAMMRNARFDDAGFPSQQAGLRAWYPTTDDAAFNAF